MTQPSVRYQLIETRLDGTLADFVAARRPAASWQAIADEIYKLTRVDVSDETLRLWFSGRIAVEARVVA